MKFVKGIPPKFLRDRFGLYTGGNRVGWNGEMDRCWVDNESNICVCSRLIRTKQFGNVEHVTITKGTGTTDGTGEVTWSEKMQIKNELFGENRFAIEVFPKAKNLVDVCDVYHLWVFDKKLDLPFGISRGEYQPAVNRGYCVTAEELKALKADYQRTGKL